MMAAYPYEGAADFIALCFAKADRDAAMQIAETLQENRVRVWWDSRGKFNEKRFGNARTALILISENWKADTRARAHLASASALELETVLLFLDGTDLSGDETLTPYLSRAFRMLDYDDTLSELMLLPCTEDCRMLPDEPLPEKKHGIAGIFGD